MGENQTKVVGLHFVLYAFLSDDSWKQALQNVILEFCAVYIQVSLNQVESFSILTLEDFLICFSYNEKIPQGIVKVQLAFLGGKTEGNY